MSPTINLNRKSLALLIAIVCSGSAQGEEYYFDPALLQGATYGQNIARFNERQTPSGDYLADVYVNGTLVTSSTNIRFNAVKEGQQTEPCLPLSVMKAAQIKSLPATDAATECRPLREWVPHAGWQFDSATLRLLLTIPMTELTHKPRGYISPSEWDSGALALFLRHNTTTHTENTDSHYRYQYLWSGLNMGVNLGLWQVVIKVICAMPIATRAEAPGAIIAFEPGCKDLSRLLTVSCRWAIAIRTPAYSAVCLLTGLSLSPTSGCARRANAVMRRKFGA